VLYIKTGYSPFKYHEQRRHTFSFYQHRYNYSQSSIRKEISLAMPFSLYDVVVPPFITGLETLTHLLETAQENSKSSTSEILPEAKLCESKLIEDMGNLVYQIQRISDTAKGSVVRLAGVENVPMADDETSFADMHERITKTIKVLQDAPKEWPGAEERDVVLRTAKGERKFTGADYVQKYAVPNFYFHLCMAYAILRKEGVPVGKADYLGRNNKSKVTSKA
jgi:uncharacterized protein